MVCFVATTGALGMTLWENGALKANNSSNPQATRTTGIAFVVGDMYGGDSGDAGYALVVPWNVRLSNEQASELSKSPWKLFKKQDRRILIPSAGGGGLSLTGSLTGQGSTLSLSLIHI